jgi:hypothetical protein
MIYPRSFDRGRAAMLKCDKCGRELLDQSIDIQISVFCAHLDLELGQEPTDEQRRELRQIAQDAGWSFMLADVWGNMCRDLCPTCFTLPPEG